MRRSDIAASAVKKSQYPAELLPQVALFGRSNAGKSSLINTIIQRKNLARTSSAPGKTRLLNFYRADAITDEGAPLLWHFVDMPGYGYAKAAKSERAHWLAFMEEYLTCDCPKICWQLVDIRHEPSREDIFMHDVLLQQGLSVQLIANKIDKVSKNQRFKSLAVIAKTMNVPADQIIPFSAVTGEGKEKLQQIIEDYLLEKENISL